MFEILKIEILKIFFENFEFTIVPYGETKPQLSGKRAIVEQKGVKYGTQDHFRLYMCNFWNFGHLPSFMPKYGNFENRPVSRKPLLVERK